MLASCTSLQMPAVKANFAHLTADAVQFVDTQSRLESAFKHILVEDDDALDAVLAEAGVASHDGNCRGSATCNEAVSEWDELTCLCTVELLWPASSTAVLWCVNSIHQRKVLRSTPFKGSGQRSTAMSQHCA
eukprot:6451684-Amphidinium_carterae.1